MQRLLGLVLAIGLSACRVGDLPKTTVDGSTNEDGGGDGQTDAGSTVPDGSLGVGLPCSKDTVNQDCPLLEDAVCLERFLNDALVYPGGYCSTEGCGGDSCGVDAACVEIWVTSYCLKTCLENEDCRKSEGYACKRMEDLLDIDAGGPDAGTYCLPPDLALPDGSM